MKNWIIWLSISLLLITTGCITREENPQTSGTGEAQGPVRMQQVANRAPALNSPNLTNSNNLNSPATTEYVPFPLFSWTEKYPLVFGGPFNRNNVALTFDDGPDLTYTPQVLDVLKKHRVRATFFLMGQHSEQHPEMVRRILREGHVIGNHSYNHPDLQKLTDSRFHDQILRTQQILQRITGYSPVLFRPPYGSIGERQVQWLAQQRFLTVVWNVDPEDWASIPADQVIKGVVPRTWPGSIILQHSSTGEGGNLSGSVKSLDTIIPQLRKKGARLVTIPEMFNIVPYRR